MTHSTLRYGTNGLSISTSQSCEPTKVANLPKMQKRGVMNGLPNFKENGVRFVSNACQIGRYKCLPKDHNLNNAL